MSRKALPVAATVRATGAILVALLLAPWPGSAQDGARLGLAVELEGVDDFSASSLREGLRIRVEAGDAAGDRTFFREGEGLMLFVFAVEDGTPVSAWGSRRIRDLVPGSNELDLPDLPSTTDPSSRRVRGVEALLAALERARPLRGEVPFLPAEALMSGASGGGDMSILLDALAEAAGGAVEDFVVFVVLPMEPDELSRWEVRPLFGVLP